jgi:hypothetical protein
MPIPHEITTLVIFDDDYLRYWPQDALPLGSVEAGAAGTLRTAAIPSPGCLEYGFRRLRWVPAGTGDCPGTLARR